MNIYIFGFDNSWASVMMGLMDIFQQAKQMLETTHDSFDEISYEMGYRNSGSFRKIFVKWVALLPSEYRKRFRAYS